MIDRDDLSNFSIREIWSRKTLISPIVKNVVPKNILCLLNHLDSQMVSLSIFRDSLTTDRTVRREKRSII